jgi:hypothetical protein
MILCPWCHTRFPLAGPDGFFPHLTEAHPKTVQAGTLDEVARAVWCDRKEQGGKRSVTVPPSTGDESERTWRPVLLRGMGVRSTHPGRANLELTGTEL